MKITRITQTTTLNENITGNLEIEGENIKVYGNWHKVDGWLHIKGRHIEVYNLLVNTDNHIQNINGTCPVCQYSGKYFSQNSENKTCVRICDSMNVMLYGVESCSSLPLTEFSTFNNSTNYSVTNCFLNGQLVQ